jgi:hypothetical protein
MWNPTECVARAARQEKGPQMSEAESSENQSAPTDPQQFFQVHLVKSNFFRVVHGDGVWSSISPFNHLHLTFYSERFPLPTTIFFPIKDGVTQSEDWSKRESKKDWVREMEVDVVLSLETAKSVYESIGRFIQMQENPDSLP